MKNKPICVSVRLEKSDHEKLEKIAIKNHHSTSLQAKLFVLAALKKIIPASDGSERDEYSKKIYKNIKI